LGGEIRFASKVGQRHMLTGSDSSGGAIGAGLFVSSGGAFQTGGPGAVLIGFMIIGECWTILYELTNLMGSQ
jgi:amino acid permease